MEELVNIFVKSIFIDNMVFAYFLGMCSYLAVSRTVKTSVGLGFAVIFVLGFTVPVNYLLENYILGRGALAWLGPQFASVDLSFLTFIMFIAIIAAMVQLVEMIIEKFSPTLIHQPWYISASYCCKLRYTRRFSFYAGTQLRQYFRSSVLWTWEVVWAGSLPLWELPQFVKKSGIQMFLLLCAGWE
jgi:hypothetical protein